MSDLPIAWLPPEIDISVGTFQKIVQILYAKFQMDIKCGNLHFANMKVGYFPGYEPSGMGYEKTFWHLITVKEAQTEERSLDYQRAPKLSWIKPILENYSDPRIKAWDYQEAKKGKGIRTYVWLEEMDFLIVMKKVTLCNHNKQAINIITSFHIDGPSYKAKIQTKWRKRIHEYK